MRYHIGTSTVRGSVTVPGSKSHTMRAVLFASMAHGESQVHNYLPSPDTEAMIAACSALGAAITRDERTLTILGTGARLRVPEGVIDAGNSGQVLRFVGALTALLPQQTIITGDHSICTLRPMNPLLEGLTQAGALAVSTKGDGYAPIIIRGKARAAHMHIDGQDSQPVSALLMLAAFLDGESTITVENAGELPWISLTLHWLDKIGARYTNHGFTRYTVTGPTRVEGFEYIVPGDWSSAAFPIAAALVRNEELTLENMDFNDPQGDKAIVAALQSMGARFTLDVPGRRLAVHKHDGLRGADLDVNAIIDAVPVLAAVACFAGSPTTITGAAIARHKECDRLHAIAQELGKMGARIEERPDGLVIHPATLRGAAATSWHDHRIAMSVAVAALSCGETTIEDVACVAKSYPGFAPAMRSLGADIREENEGTLSPHTPQPKG